MPALTLLNCMCVDLFLLSLRHVASIIIIHKQVLFPRLWLNGPFIISLDIRDDRQRRTDPLFSSLMLFSSAEAQKAHQDTLTSSPVCKTHRPNQSHHFSIPSPLSTFIHSCLFVNQRTLFSF